MSHTNSTSNYNLPQFITTDKPAWLTDINNAFLAIDTGMDAAKDAADAAQLDATAAGTAATAAGTAAATADAKGSGAVASLADAFLTSATYAVDDLVTYNNLLYKCTTAVVTPGEWTGSSNWTRVNVEDIVPKTASDLPIGTTASGTKGYIDTQLALKQNKIKAVDFDTATDAAGNAKLGGVDVANNIVLAVNSGSAYCTNVVASGGYWYTKCLNSSGSPIVSSVVHLYVYYL